RQPGVFDAPPQDFDQVQLRRIRGQILDDQSFLLPVREPVFKFLTRMDRRIVYDHHRLFRERLTKGIKTGYHHTGVYGEQGDAGGYAATEISSTSRSMSG